MYNDHRHDIKLHYKTTVIKTAWYRHKSGHIDEWNRIESPEINPGLYCQIIFINGGMSIQWSENSFFNKYCWENWTGTCKKKNETRPPTYTIHQNKLNLSHDNIKVLAENIGSKISDIPCNNIYDNISPILS